MSRSVSSDSERQCGDKLCAQMPFDSSLAERVEDTVGNRSSKKEKKAQKRMQLGKRSETERKSKRLEGKRILREVEEKSMRRVIVEREDKREVERET